MTVGLGWPVARLASLAASHKGAIAGGPFGSDLVSTDYVSEGVPVIRGTNLPSDSKLSLDNLVFVTEAKADALHLNCAHPGDLVFTQRGTLGQIGLIPQDSPYPRYVISQSQMKMTVDATKANPLYLYYYFRLRSTIQYIENHALQAGVPHINLGILRKLEVVAPPPDIQGKLAAILATYDDLIANNQRRIALLETMAEEIYREWFVRLRFPGFAAEQVRAGVAGEWELRSLDELGTFMNGYAFDPTEWFTYGLPIVKIKELNSGVSVDTPRNPGDKLSQKYKFGDGDIIFSWSGSLVVRIWDQGDAWVNQHLFKVMPAEHVPRAFLYLSIKFAIPIFESLTTGATMQHIKRKELKFVKVRMPPATILDAFRLQVEPMLEGSLQLKKINRRLVATRDALLPRLISGKLKIDHLDVRLPPSMQEKVTA